MTSQREWILELQRVARQVRDRYDAVWQRAQGAAGRIAQELGQALDALAQQYLPALDEATLARAAQLAGFKGFERRDPLRARDHERRVLETALTQLRADPRYLDRERQVGAGGELTQALAGAQAELAPHQQACDRFEQLDGFLRLIEVCYDTPAFAVPWYRAEYWKLWAAGDKICRDLDLGDFGDDVLPRYRAAAAPRDLLRGEVGRLTGEIDAIHDLVRRHDETAYRLANLDAIYLTDARRFLAEHLDLADLALLGEWAAGDAAVLAGLRPLAGARAKRVFIKELSELGLPAILQRLDARIGKYERRLGRLNRGRPLDAADEQDPFLEKAPALLAEADKLDKRIEALVASREYQAFELDAAPALQWLQLTHAPPPRALAETRAWYDQHPDEVLVYTTEYATSTNDQAAAAFMAGRDDAEQGGGYLS